MKLWSDSFKDGAKIPTPFAFCKIDGATHAAMSDNRNPHLAWSDLPENTRSLVLICHDYDVPSKATTSIRKGKPSRPICHESIFITGYLSICLPASIPFPKENFPAALRQEAKTVPKHCTDQDRVSMTIRHGSPATRTWKAITTATTDHVLPGTTPSRTITFSPCMRWMWKNCRLPVALTVRMSLPP